MAFEYIMGGPSSGKTNLCMQRINKLENNSNPDEKIFLIVPEQFSLQTEIELANITGSLVKTKVMSFTKLCLYAFEDITTIKKSILGEVGKSILLKKILLDCYHKKEFLFFTSEEIILKSSHFIDELSLIINEFYVHKTTPTMLEHFILQTNNTKHELKLKIHDIYTIYNKYDAYVKQKYLSFDTILDVLAKEMVNIDLFDDSTVFIDNFYNFTPQEYCILNKIIKVCRDFIFCVPIDVNQKHVARYKDIKITDPYFIIKNTINNLSDLANKNKINFNSITSLDKIYKNSSEITFLTKYYFSNDNITYESKPKDIFLHQVSSIREEITTISNKIIEYVTKYKFKFSQIAVIVNDSSKYLDEIEIIFEDSGIPFFIDQTQSIVYTNLILLINSALEIIINGISYENVFMFLKLNLLSDFCLDEIDLLESYVCKHRINNNDWYKNWMFGFGDYRLDEVLFIKSKVMHYINWLTQNIDPKNKYPTKFLCNFIKDMLNELKIKNIYNSDNKKILDNIYETMYIINKIFSNYEFDTQEFAFIFNEGIRKVRIGTLPKYSNVVLIGNLKRTRFNHINILFLTGMNKIKPDDIDCKLLSTEEKKYLNEFGLKFYPRTKQKIFEKEFLIYNFATKPYDKLHISCCVKDVFGKKIEANNIFKLIKHRFNNFN
jgi:ATP-dependent helicase/nuclease subunit B